MILKYNSIKSNIFLKFLFKLLIFKFAKILIIIKKKNQK
jgi:hypothetical protein